MVETGIRKEGTPEPDPKGMLGALEEAHSKKATIQNVTDVEWDIRIREWERERQTWIRQMVDNSIWAMGSPLVKAKDTDPDTDLQDQVVILGPKNFFGLDPQLLRGVTSEVSQANHGQLTRKSKAAGFVPIHPAPSLVANKVRPVKVKKLSRLELLKYLSDWDKASYGRRDAIVMDFLKIYKTKDNVYDADALFHCGGSLIFSRFAISLQICFLRHRVVWHYFDALGILVKSLQGDRFSEEYLRLGGLSFICEVIRVEQSGLPDKHHACKFLVDLMKGRNSIAVKMFICESSHFLESLVDSLTMCKDKKLIGYCGLFFENLCIESTAANIAVVTTYVMRLLPCDFNPSIQSMAFRVLQNVIRLKPSVGAKCLKPILDNLKTEDMDLLVEMSNASLVILQTKYGPELVNQLMSVAEGIQLREQFRSVFKPHMRKGRNHPTKEQALDLRKAREKHERVRQKITKFDHFMQQAGALFVLNRMMTNKIEFVTEFTRQGIFGLSLKTLGSCPHWEVQGQGVTMVQFLHAMSIECAVSYFLMLPEKMMSLILEKPAECLRYFTAPICVLLRKLGRFALRLWDRWVQKVVNPAQEVSVGGVLPDYFSGMCKMMQKVHEIQSQINDLLTNPVMESFPKSSDGSTTQDDETLDDDITEFLTDDDEDICQYRTGKEALFEGKRFKPFSDYLEFHNDISDDKLDIKVNKSQPSVLLSTDSDKNELGAYEQALLEDAERKTKENAASTPNITDGASDPPGTADSEGEIGNDEDDKKDES